MLRSMTGFGGATGEVDGIQLSVELRSVNNRYFRLTTKMPEFLSSAGPEIEKLLRSRLGRGAITLSVRLRLPPDRLNELNLEVLTGYMEQLRPLDVEANPMLRIDLGSMLQLPGVLEQEPESDLAAKTVPALLGLIDQAIEKLIAMRTAEGLAIESDLADQCGQITDQLTGVAAHAPEVVQQYHERLKARVQELTGSLDVAVDQDALAREVAIFAERCDIAEEISRLSGHVAQFGKIVAEGSGPNGRRLDFLSQEMLREANTIAAKANDAEIVRSAVDIKTAVDRIKEQVQNVE